MNVYYEQSLGIKKRKLSDNIPIENFPATVEENKDNDIQTKLLENKY